MIERTRRIHRNANGGARAVTGSNGLPAQRARALTAALAACTLLVAAAGAWAQPAPPAAASSHPPSLADLAAVQHMQSLVNRFDFEQFHPPRPTPYCTAFLRDLRTLRGMEVARPWVIAEHYGAPQLAPYRERCAAFPINQRLLCDFKLVLPTGKLRDDLAWYQEAGRDVGCWLLEVTGAVRVYEIELDHRRGKRPAIVAFGEGFQRRWSGGSAEPVDLGASYLVRAPDCRPTSVADGIEGTRINWSVHDSGHASALVWYRDRWLVVSSTRGGLESWSYRLELESLESRPAVRQHCLFFSGNKPPPARPR